MNLFELKIEDVAVQQMPLYFVSGKLSRTRNGQSRQNFLWKAAWDQRLASKSRDLSTRNLSNISKPRDKQTKGLWVGKQESDIAIKSSQRESKMMAWVLTAYDLLRN